MRIHILGICGTFMGGLAMLARSLGHEVTGSDANVYPPMSTLLEKQGISLIQGYDASQLEPQPDLVIVGNAMTRGNPCVEAVLERNIPYMSGPQWLHDFVLRDRWVVAVAGTHGKTTTAGMATWILEACGYKPGFVIGGVPGNFDVSARLGDSPFFVIEADEYDCAFFDKRSKFVHYCPRTLILNNLEFDHADIFDDLKAIQKQFHHLVRIVPGQGRIILPENDINLKQTMAMGCWSEQELVGEQGHWQAKKLNADASEWEVLLDGEKVGEVKWGLVGEHNMHNGLMAIAAARHVGVLPADAANALGTFINARRRLELRGEAHGVTVYDDFAHHPTHSGDACRIAWQSWRHRAHSGRTGTAFEHHENGHLQRRSRAVLRACRRSLPAATAAYSVAGGRSGRRLHSAGALECGRGCLSGYGGESRTAWRSHSGDEQRRVWRDPSEAAGRSGEESRGRRVKKDPVALALTGPTLSLLPLTFGERAGVRGLLFVLRQLAQILENQTR